MKKALIVDDITENLYLLESLLKAYGYVTTAARNGVEALELAHKDLPDIIISDILMPVMDGYSLCREWKKDSDLKEIPFIFYTATYTHPKDGEFALSLGADRFIIKPQEPEEFMDIVEQVLSEFKANRLFARQPSESSEVVQLKEYNETLIRKMEDRMRKSEEAEKKIRIYASKLEAEIEHREQISKSLRESELRFRTLAESSPVGIFTTNKKGWTTYVNQRWCEISGLNFEEALGTNWIKSIHSDDRERLKADWQQAFQSGLVSKLEYRFIRPDGLVAWVIGQAIPQKDSGGSVLGYIGTITDITDRKEMEARLIASKEKAEESDRLKTAFLNNISHEIRTPLNSIVGFSNLIAEPGYSLEDRKNFTEIISQSSSQLTSIIENIIQIATIEAGQQKIDLKQINVNAICQLVQNQFVEKAQKQNISLNCHTPLSNDKSQIITDSSKLIRILTNLVENAVKFTNQGTVSFGYKMNGKHLEFFVRDTGIGIAPEMQEEIFKHFRQVENSATRKFSGSGLGLAISKADVQLLGGKIWVESEIGKGSTFSFTIPYNT